MKKMFSLTLPEQRLIVFIVAVLVAAAWCKHQHAASSNMTQPPASAAAESPRPNE